MENINWKEKACQIIEYCSGDNKDEDGNVIYYKWEVIKAMINFAKLACEEQKKICADIAEIKMLCNADTMLEAPLVKFD